MMDNENKPADENPDSGNAVDQSFTEFSETQSDNELERLRAQLKETETRALRYQADLDNFRRRTRRESEEQLKYAGISLMTEILDAVDNLQRAIDSVSDSEKSGSLVQGVQMVAAQIQSALNQAGCRPIESAGAKFDPNQHQAVQMVGDVNIPANHIVQELRTGFVLHDRVLRPAQVIVSTGPQ